MTVTRFDDKINLEKTITVMNIPENNTLPCGVIKDKVLSHHKDIL